jgi:F-type H+-transporting ATPase subunit a
MTRFSKYIFIVTILALPLILVASGSKESEEGKFNLVEFAMHHISDSYSWDFYSKKDGSKVGISLPRILWDKSRHKLNLFMSTHAALRAGYVDEKEFNAEAREGDLLIPGANIKIEELNEKLKIASDTLASHKMPVEYEETLKNLRPLDFSITKNVLFIFLVTGIMIWLFISIAKQYKKNPDKAPKGAQSLFEPIIVFIRDDIAKENIPHHYEKYLPYLLNVFFFIWFLNMMGMVPFSGNVTGNIAVTASLAILTLLITNFSANKTYWHHIFWFPGVPVFIKPIMFIVEFIGVFTKPFALTIRLFANMTAGHMVIISFISLIFIFGKLGTIPAVGFATSLVSIIFSLFIDLIELFIALLQAYIFTMLSALFIGQAVETEH